MATNPTTIGLNKIDHEAAHDLRTRYDQRPHGQGYRYYLEEVTEAGGDAEVDAHVYDDAQHAYRGTVIRADNGLWKLFHTRRDRYAQLGDHTKYTVLGLVDYFTYEDDADHHAGYMAYFATRHDAALYALLSN